MFQLACKITPLIGDELLSTIREAAREPLEQMAEITRDTARSMILPAVQKSLSQLDQWERKRYSTLSAIALRTGKPEPELPFAHSRPGEPPVSPHGQYPRSILAAALDSQLRAVAGPAGWSNVPNKLEFGRGNVEPRPLMGPALERASGKFVSLFRDIL